MPVTLSPEDVRLTIGLSKTEWTQLSEKYNTRQILSLWEKFKRITGRALDYEFAIPSYVLEGVPYVTAIQASRATGIGEFHLANLRDRDKLQGTRHGRRTIYTRQNLDDLFQPKDGRKSSLSGPFLRWIALLDD